MTHTNFKILFWDFDGVLMNSNETRDLGFIETLKQYPKEDVDALLNYHHKNGGLSRYVKFRYFFEEIRNESISEEKILNLASSFSSIMKQKLCDPALLIKDTMNYVKENYLNMPMHIVSGSDQAELRFLCEEIGIGKYFTSIHGSPTHKTQLVKELLEKHQYNTNECILIGDSINDWEAANKNNISFMEFNNPSISHLSDATLF